MRWWNVLSTAGEGFVDFALLPEDIERDAAAARDRGLDLEGPMAGGRLRPDGARLDWQNVRPKTNDLPFWCSDVTPRPAGSGRRDARPSQRRHRRCVIASRRRAMSPKAPRATRRWPGLTP